MHALVVTATSTTHMPYICHHSPHDKSCLSHPGQVAAKSSSTCSIDSQPPHLPESPRPTALLVKCPQSIDTPGATTCNAALRSDSFLLRLFGFLLVYPPAATNAMSSPAVEQATCIMEMAAARGVQSALRSTNYTPNATAHSADRLCGLISKRQSRFRCFRARARTGRAP